MKTETKIDLENFEAWLLDYAEGALSAGDNKRVELFMEQHPELGIEPEVEPLSVLIPDHSINYPHTEALLQNEPRIPFSYWKFAVPAAACVLFLLGWILWPPASSTIKKNYLATIELPIQQRLAAHHSAIRQISKMHPASGIRQTNKLPTSVSEMETTTLVSASPSQIEAELRTPKSEMLAWQKTDINDSLDMPQIGEPSAWQRALLPETMENERLSLNKASLKNAFNNILAAVAPEDSFFNALFK